MKKSNNKLYEQLLTQQTTKITPSKLKKHNDNIELVKQLTLIPKKETVMPKLQVFEENYLDIADLLFMPTGAFGYKYILVIVDAHTKKCDAEPIKNKLSSSVAKAMDKIYKRNIIKKPKILGVDNGTEFKDEVKNYTDKNDIVLKVGHTNRHRQQSLVEAKNKIIGSNLLNLLNHKELDTGKYSKDWTKHLKPLISLINDNLPKPITKEITPNPIITKTNNEIIPIGTKVRVTLDVNKDITGKKLIGWRSGDIRFSKEIKEVENFILKSGFPIMYTIKGEKNIFRTREQLQII